MISKQKIKLIHSLELKKNREAHGLFVGEGPKIVCEFINHYKCKYLVAQETWATSNTDIITKSQEVDIVSSEELSKASLLKAPQNVIAIFEKPANLIISPSLATKDLCLALDCIQDPGNFGTIIRIANWFGIKNIICSLTTADVYSPKVIQATMGALTGVNVFYTDLCEYFQEIEKDIPIYGTFLEGQNIYKTSLTDNGIIIMGNEGNGISPNVGAYVNSRLYIPPFDPRSTTTESLNVAIATAITCSEFRRRL